jgi:hypothetical protein
VSRRSLTKAQAKVTELWREPAFAVAAARFGTDPVGARAEDA